MLDGKYPVAFDVLEDVTTRGTVEQLLRKELAVTMTAPPVTKMLADWPFAGYLTSNYDGLLSKALRAINDTGPAWTIVGNTQNEVRKLSGGAARRVWHIHGAVDLPADRSKLILNTSNYAAAYAPGSPIVEMFKALLAVNRLVFIGFGFGDDYLLGVLIGVSALVANPSRPIIAILPDSSTEDQRQQLSRSSNVEVLLYPAGGNHEKLHEFVQLHGYLIYGRSQHLRQPERRCPSYDEETTGLLLYDELCLSDSARVRDDVLLSLLEMKVLAHLSSNPTVSTTAIASDLRARVSAIRGPSARIDETGEIAGEMKGALLRLQSSGFVDIVEGGNVRLTAKGIETVGRKRSVAERFSDEFSSSVLARVEREAPTITAVQLHRVASTAETFVKESTTSRAIAMATALTLPIEDQKQHSIVGLLQHLPDYIKTMHSAEEALPLIKTITGLLVDPSPSERKYISVLLQATFSTSLLGCDATTIRTRIRELRETAFLLDASVRVPFFAVGSSGHVAAISLLEKLKSLGCNVFTTTDFVRELASHAIAAKQYYRSDKPQTTKSLDRARTGGSGKQNAFVDGFHRSLDASGTILKQAGMQQYLATKCGLPLVLGPRTDNISIVTTAIENAGIRILDAKSLDETLSARAAGYERRIRAWREGNASLGHHEQPLAEANATVFVEGIRSRMVPSVNCPQSYFVSTTRFVDSLTHTRVVFAPDALLQFVITLSGWSDDELEVLGANLFSELIERNIVLLDSRQLSTIFMPLIDLSKGATR